MKHSSANTMNLTEFSDNCKEIFSLNPFLPPPDASKIEKLHLLTTHMLEVNKSMNLTAIKDENAIILRHYADSLAISELLDANSTVIDVGSGAGFPTLPLAIFRPDLKIVALDGTAKRIEYVKQTAALLGLDNVSAVSGRAEELGNDPKFRETFNYATARAVAALPILTELCLPFVGLGGQFIAMKAQKAAEELDAAKSAIAKCGGALRGVSQRDLTDRDKSIEARTIIVVDKISRTPKEIPRHFSKISKKPL